MVVWNSHVNILILLDVCILHARFVLILFIGSNLDRVVGKSGNQFVFQPLLCQYTFVFGNVGVYSLQTTDHAFKIPGDNTFSQCSQAKIGRREFQLSVGHFNIASQEINGSDQIFEAFVELFVEQFQLINSSNTNISISCTAFNRMSLVRK